MPDPNLRWFRSTERSSVHVEGQTFVPDDEGYIGVPDNLAPKIMVIPGFEYVGRERNGSRKLEQPKSPKARTGRPEEFPWDEIWIEICRRVYEEGIPATAAEMIRLLQQWCEDQYGKEPGDSTLKPKVRKLYQVLRRDEH